MSTEKGKASSLETLKGESVRKPKPFFFFSFFILLNTMDKFFFLLFGQLIDFMTLEHGQMQSQSSLQDAGQEGLRAGTLDICQLECFKASGSSSWPYLFAAIACSSRRQRVLTWTLYSTSPAEWISWG